MKWFLSAALRHALGARRFQALRVARAGYRRSLLDASYWSQLMPEPYDLWEANLSHLDRYREMHRGQRCFIIGNGPSLRKTDLSLLKNEVTFGMNRIYLLPENLSHIPTYYVAVNSLVIEQCASDIERLECPVFLNWRNRCGIRFGSNVNFLHEVNYPCFSPDVRTGVWTGATVTYVAIQLAYYMGFREVYLLGVDHFFQTQGKAHEVVVSPGKDPNHFDDNYFGKGFRWQLPDLATSELAYKMALQKYGTAGRSILDATIGGKLHVFPKVDYETLMLAEPSIG